MKGAPSRTNHRGEPRVYPIVDTSQQINLGFADVQPVRQVGALSFPEKQLWRGAGEICRRERSFSGHSKSRHVSKQSFIRSLIKMFIAH